MKDFRTEKGGQGVDHDETPDHVEEMDEFTEVWNNLGLRVDGGCKREVI